MRPSHIALAVLVTAIWGVNFVVIEVGLDHFPPLLFSALRFLVAAVPAVFFVGRPKVAWDGSSPARSKWRTWRWVVGVGLALGVMKFGLLFVGMNQGMPAGLSSLVLQIQAVFTALFAFVALGERPGRIRLAGMVVALAGIGVAAVDEGTSGPLLGFTLVVVAAVGWGVSNVLTRKAAPSAPFTFMVWASAVPVLPLLALSLAFDGWDRDTQALASLDWTGSRHRRVRRLGHHALRLRRLELPAAQPPRLVGRPVHAARPGVRDVVRRALPRRERQPPALVRRRAARRRCRPLITRARSPGPGRPPCGHSGARAARRGP